jgi:hypothetical protein
MYSWVAITRTLCGAVLVLSLFPVDGMCQTSKDADLVERIRAKAKRIEEFKALMNNPDANIRIGTIEALIEGDDQILRDIAIETGFASNDVIVRAAALRALFFTLDTIPVAIATPGKDGKEGKEYIVSLRFKNIDRAKGSFVMAGAGYTSTGQVSGTTVTMTWGNCSFVLQPKDGFTISGPSDCQGQKGTASAKLR